MTPRSASSPPLSFWAASAVPSRIPLNVDAPAVCRNHLTACQLDRRDVPVDPQEMDLASGFAVEDPPIVVSWGITEDQLRELVPSVHEVTSGYHVCEAVSLGGLRHMLGFHFEPRQNGQLAELEFFRKSYPDQTASFHEFQDHLEATFGPAQETDPGTVGFPSYRWTVQGAVITHYILDRFGHEEHVRIQRPLDLRLIPKR